MKNMMGPHTPVIVGSWSFHCPSLSGVFDSLHSLTNYTAVRIKNCLKSHFEKYGQFLITQRKPSCATTKLMLFTVGRDEWNTKEDTGKSLKNALHVLRYAKRHLLGWSDVEHWKNQTRSLSRYWATLAWRQAGWRVGRRAGGQAGRPAVSQSVENSVKKKFRGNFLKAFRVDLKACLGLVIILPHRRLRKFRLVFG